MSTTQNVSDRIAPGWYNFRHHTIFLKELESLAERWQRGKLLNVGCAHGPDFPPFARNFELYGVDISAKMLELALKYAAKYNFSVNLTQADARRLPYADESFDRAIAVATYHHIEDNDERLKALIELTTLERQLVLDPFCGSGSTMVAAKALDRLYLGFDTSSEYIATAKQRLEDLPMLSSIKM